MQQNPMDKLAQDATSAQKPASQEPIQPEPSGLVLADVSNPEEPVVERVYNRHQRRAQAVIARREREALLKVKKAKKEKQHVGK